MSLISLEGALSRLQSTRVSDNGMHQNPEHPILVPEAKNDQRFELSPKAAQAQKVLTFAGSRRQVAPGVQLESRFIETLRNSKNTNEAASVAEMLGRAHSLNAIPALKEKLSPQEPTPVRKAAIEALGEIGDSTHGDSFTRGDLGRTLIRVYEKRRQVLSAGKPAQGDEAGVKPLSPQAREGLKEELSVLARAIGKLNVEAGRNLLVEDFKQAFTGSEQALQRTHEMMRVMRMAETELYRSLEERFKKPMEQIKKELSPIELAKIQASAEIRLSDGSSMSLGEVSARIKQLQYQQKFSAGLTLGLMEGLIQKPDRQALNALSIGLKSSQPQIKAKTLALLGEQKMLNYASDILPHLTAKQPAVRQAALGALLHSDDEAARQKTIEFLNPVAFAQVLNEPRMGQEGLAAFREFVSQVAQNGDGLINTLARTVLNSDFDLTTRQMALLPIGMMVQEPVNRELSPVTVKKATDIIRSLAKNPAGIDPSEKETMSLLATHMWVGTKEPEAIRQAANWLDGQHGRLDEKAQTELLVSIFKALQESFGEGGLNNKKDPDSFSRLVLDILGNNEVLPPDKLDELREGLKPGLVESLLGSGDDDNLMHGSRQQAVPDKQMTSALEKQLDEIRPALHRMLNHRSSVENRVLSAQVLGLFNDRGSTEALIEKTRNPLKGMVDWNRPNSFRGNPSMMGASIRRQSIQSLGRIGDAKAVDVMLDALDDPGLKMVTLPALANLGDEANQTLSWQKLKKVREKLLHVMSDPSTTRMIRAIRIDAANTLFQFKGGVDALKDYISKADNPNFKRHAVAGLLKNDYAVDPKHPDHDLVKNQIHPGLGVERLHAKGLTGKNVEMAIIDGGYVDAGNKEAFQDRVKLPASFKNPEHYHPTMVMSTAAGNGKLKGVAPDALVYSDKWPELGGPQPMEVYKKLIEGKLRGENNIRVINNSWGFSNNNVVIYQDVRDILKEFKKVVDLAEKAGMVFVFAAGNEGEEQGIPSLGTLSLFGIDVDKLTDEEKEDLDYVLDKVVLVGASNTLDSEDIETHQLADFSSIGDSLDNRLRPTVVAPGVDMMTYSWGPGNKRPKELVNGTSFASPYVSGVISLMFQKNPDLTPLQVRNILKTTAVKLPDLPDTFQGHGSVDPHAAIAKSKNYGKPARKQPPAEAPPKAEVAAKKDKPASA